MKKGFKIVLIALCIVLLICMCIFGFVLYKLNNIDDSWCPSGFYLKDNFKIFSCDDCNLTLRQIKKGVEYKRDGKCENINKVCYMCEQPPLPFCQCMYEFETIKLNNFEGYLLKLIYNK